MPDTPIGLTTLEARRGLAENGPNALVDVAERPWLQAKGLRVLAVAAGPRADLALGRIPWADPQDPALLPCKEKQTSVGEPTTVCLIGLIVSSIVDLSLVSGLALGGVLMTALPATVLAGLCAAAVVFALVLDAVKVALFQRLAIA